MNSTASYPNVILSWNFVIFSFVNNSWELKEGKSVKSTILVASVPHKDREWLLTFPGQSSKSKLTQRRMSRFSLIGFPAGTKVEVEAAAKGGKGALHTPPHASSTFPAPTQTFFHSVLTVHAFLCTRCTLHVVLGVFYPPQGLQDHMLDSWS